MMSRLDVSVVIPFRWTEGVSLSRAAKSALAQTYEILELLIIDDNSEKSAEGELAGISDPRLKIIKMVSSVGGGQARNIGADTSQGQLIAFLDADDFWFPHKIATQVAQYKENERSDILYYSACLLEKANKLGIKQTKIKSPRENIAHFLFVRRGMMQTSGWLMHRAICEKVKFKQIPRHQDYQFLMDAEDCGIEFIGSPMPLYAYSVFPKINDITYSLSWIETNQRRLSEKAVKNFVAVQIVPSLILAKEFKRLIQIFIKYPGASLFVSAMRVLVKWIMRKEWRKAIRL